MTGAMAYWSGRSYCTESGIVPARVDAHVAVFAQGVRGAEQHHEGEEIPLQLEPGVRAHAERIAQECVARADQAGEEHAPGGEPAGHAAQRVDGGNHLKHQTGKTKS